MTPENEILLKLNDDIHELRKYVDGISRRIYILEKRETAMKNKKSSSAPREIKLTDWELVEVEQALTTKILCIKRGDMGPVRPKWIRILETIRTKILRDLA